MRRNRIFGITALLIAGIVFILTLGSCVEHNLPAIQVDTSCLDVVSYSDDVHSVIMSNCAITGCHNGDNGDDLNWKVFDNFQSHATHVQDRITRNVLATGHMPKTGSISQEQIQTIYCWVQQGANDN